TKISGSSATIMNPSSAATSITSLVQGVYSFELKVTDNQGATGRDTITVTVNAATNMPPAANAGADKTITLPVNSATLAGSGNDADGTVVTYYWKKISGPALYNIVNPGSPVTDVSGLVQGSYLFELTVTDNNGAKGKDTVSIEVMVAPNIPPTANAGPDQTIVLPTDSTFLFGSGLDTDGSLQAFLWRQVSGPSISGIVAANAAVTSVKNLIGGTYQFELLVTDNHGAAAKDSVFIVVAAPRLNPSNKKSFKIYPNSITDIATLEITTEKSNEPLRVIITDMQGRIAYKKTVYATQNIILDKIDMSRLVTGMYAITIYFNGSEKQTVKVLKGK
ncbi:MAG: T9SS type A sorting domain-containing protein, partial [Bacteroidota bacterium]|nr:T9SS type A sorting domain-containing protein [Bacteroidota bacterium]